MKDAKELLMEVIAEKEKMATYFSYQERENNVTGCVPWIDEVHEHTAKQSPLDGMEDCVAVHYSSSNEAQIQECRNCGGQFSNLQVFSHHCLTIHRKEVEQHFREYACLNCCSSVNNKKRS